MAMICFWKQQHRNLIFRYGVIEIAPGSHCHFPADLAMPRLSVNYSSSRELLEIRCA
jgi:hypothetical protein